MKYERFIEIIGWCWIAILTFALAYYGWKFIKPEEDVPVVTTHTDTTIDSASTTTTHTVVVSKPDGSSTTTVDSSVVATAHAATSSTTTTPVAVKKTRYSVGVRAIYDVRKLDVRPKAYDVDTGIRLWQSNVWIETGSRIEAGRVNEVSLGMRVEL